jgi:hypothetical protein
MRIVSMSVILLGALAAALWIIDPNLPVRAQAQGNNPNVLMLDNCSDNDPAYDDFGGCPEGTHPSLRAYRGDVPLAEFFALLTSPLAPGGQIIGHPSWRNEPSYITIRARQDVRVTNRGGRIHTFTEVTDFGGGFVPQLNGALVQAPECNPSAVTFVGVGETQRLSGLTSGLKKFQCCIHPWMRAAIRVE